MMTQAGHTEQQSYSKPRLDGTKFDMIWSEDRFGFGLEVDENGA